MANSYGHRGKVRNVIVAPVAIPSDPLQNSSNSSQPRVLTGRALARGIGSTAPGASTALESRSNQDIPGTARSRQYEQSEMSLVEPNVGGVCCNMTLTDLRTERLRSTYYNEFEAAIVEERKQYRARSPGRTIVSIANNPSPSVLFNLAKLASGTTSSGGMTMITDNIMLGGRDEAENVSLLMEHGVTHVLNTAQQLPNYFPHTFVYLKLPLLDSISANVVEVADNAVSYLSHVESVQGRVFVHCLAGVSRSVSVVLLHLVLRHHIPLRDAFRYLRACRPQINPNNAFKLQLAKLEVQELRYSSVAKDADRAWDFYEWNSIRRSMPATPPEDDNRHLAGSAGEERAGSSSSLQNAQCCCVA